MKVKVCNDTGKYQSRVYITGTNQNERASTTPDFTMSANTCFTYQFQGTYWWWEIGSYVYVVNQRELIQGSNGGTFTVHLT